MKTEIEKQVEEIATVVQSLHGDVPAILGISEDGETFVLTPGYLFSMLKNGEFQQSKEERLNFKKANEAYRKMYQLTATEDLLQITVQGGCVWLYDV